MSKALAPLLARVAVDEIETQHGAVGALVNRLLLVEKSGPNLDVEQHDAATIEARTALFGFLSSSRLAVVSKACNGIAQLLKEETAAVDIVEAKNQLLGALEAATAQHDDSQPNSSAGDHGRIVQALMRCLVSACRTSATRQKWTVTKEGTIREEEEVEGFSALVTSLLTVNRGFLYPALAHEATAFLRRRRGDQRRCSPREAVHIVGPLASAILLQPGYVNLRGGFLLKLSTASATASDAVKLSLIVLQAELMGFCAVHTAAHADVVAGWCAALANTALYLDTDAAWEKASKSVAEVALSLLSEFRERGFPITMLLSTLESLTDDDPRCLTSEVAFLGITALQSSCVDERESLLRLIRHATSIMSRHSGPSGDPKSSHLPVASIPTCELEASKVESWSLAALVYPVVSMASAGNVTAVGVLPVLEDALTRATTGIADEGTRTTSSPPNGSDDPCSLKLLRSCSTVLLGLRRLCLLEKDEVAVVRICEGLQRRASELEGNETVSFKQAQVLRANLEIAYCILAPLLLQPRIGERVRSVACATTVAMVRAIPTLGVRLLPFVLYAIRKLGGVAMESGDECGIVLSLLRVLPELGVHKVTAKPVAGVIQALASAPQPVIRGVGLGLAARLIGVNSRTFNQLHLLLGQIPEENRPPCPAEADESRLCRAAGMLHVCDADPERGLEFIRPLQAFLEDAMPAVTALALRAIAALCRGDCLDFNTALRIVSKKGKVAHTGTAKASGTAEGDNDSGDSRVMAALAELCGAGAEAAMAAEDEESDEDDEYNSEGEQTWSMGRAVETLLESRLRGHPDASVRAAVYAALHAHLPALLRAEAGADAESDAAVLASRVRTFLYVAMSREPGVEARAGLENAVGVILAVEGVEPSTWTLPKGTGRASKAGGSGDGGGGTGLVRIGPSNRLLAALPSPNDILQTFSDDISSCPGLAGAALWSGPAFSSSASTTPNATESKAANTCRNEMIALFGELLAAEAAGGGGVGTCPWQRAAMPVGVQRYVKRLLAACIATESSSSDGVGAGIDTCRRSIAGLRGVPSGLIDLALSSLGSCLPTSLAHIATEEADRAVDCFRSLTAEGGNRSPPGGIVNAQSVVLGNEIVPMCAAIAVRALPESAGNRVLEVLEEMETFDVRTTGEHRTPLGTSDDDTTAMPNDALSFWSVASVGVTSEWACRHPGAPRAKIVIKRAARHLLCSLAREIGSFTIGAVAETWFGADGGSSAGQSERVSGWADHDMGVAGGRSKAAAHMGIATTAKGLRCLALFVGLSSVLPGLRATGMHAELLQVFHVVRACQEVSICGAAYCVSTAASECLSCELVQGSAIMECLRSLSVALDGSNRHDDATWLPAAQDACLGAAGLMLACDGKVALPTGFAESVFDKLKKAIAHRIGRDTGTQVAALMALGSLFGCPLLAGGEFRPRLMRVSSMATRRTVELFVELIHGIPDTPLRAKNMAMRVWGCLAALGQDERSAGNPALSRALGWSEEGEAEAGGPCASTGGAGSIRADALHLAREGTLMSRVLMGLQAAAVGDGEFVEDDLGETFTRDGFCFDNLNPSSSLLAQSALACLEPCARTDRALRVPHGQMTTILGALFKGDHGAKVEASCVSLALVLADKDQRYSTWLRSLFIDSTFSNLSRKKRRYLVSAFDRLTFKLPPGTVGVVMMEVWDFLASALWGGSDESASSVSEELRVLAASAGDDQGVNLAAAFFSGLAIAVAKEADSVATYPVSAARVQESIASVTLGIILKTIVVKNAVREGDCLLFLGKDAPEAPLWDSFVALLQALPQSQVTAAICFEKTVTSFAPSNHAIVVRAYLAARVAAAAPPIPNSKRVPSRPVKISPGSASALGSVARWATRVTTDCAASIAVLPWLVEGLNGVGAHPPGGGSASEWRTAWYRTTLDTLSLPETCVTRAFALLCGTSILWDTSTNLAFLVAGEAAEDVLGGRNGITTAGHSTEQARKQILLSEIAIGARVHASRFAAPRAVTSAERASPNVSAEVLARLFKISGTLRAASKSNMRKADEQNLGVTSSDLVEMMVGVEGFVRGLRHSPAVLSGRQSGQFTAYARSVAADGALECVHAVETGLVR